MARPQSPTLTDGELQIMRLLWERSPATVRDLVEAQRRRPPLSYSSVATTLRILADKGHVEAEKEGRTLVYRPLLDPQGAAEDAVEFVVSRFFRHSRTLLVLNLLESEGLDAEELERLEALIGTRRKEED